MVGGCRAYYTILHSARIVSLYIFELPDEGFQEEGHVDPCGEE